MLSKVLSSREANRAEPVVFPLLSVGAVERASGRNRSHDESSEDGNAESARLREKVQQLEAQAATDCRNAFESGRQQGEQQARAELQPVLERMNTSITQIAAMRPELRRRAERDVV